MARLVPVNPQQLAQRAWMRAPGFGFASSSHLVPIVAAELAAVVVVLPLAFVRAESRYRLVAVLSLQPETNVFVTPDGYWLGGYIPAELRSYPFRLVTPPGQPQAVLCFDEESGLLTDAGAGEAFFEGDGQPAQPIREILDFLTKLEKSRLTTQLAVDALDAAGVIEPWPVQLQTADRLVPVEGLARVAEAALNGLPDDTWLALRRAGSLPVAYAQILSMGRLPLLPKARELQRKLAASGDRRQVANQDLGLNLGQADRDSLSFDW